MNVLHLKYAVEVAKTKSISKAAENLFMGQPNLSRAIKELETKLGIDIFERTMHGITVTPEGERFLEYAKRIVMQVDELESMYEVGALKQIFSVCAVEGICIDAAMAEFSSETKGIGSIAVVSAGINIDVVDAVLTRKVNLGIIRCETAEAGWYKELFSEKGILHQSAGRLTYCLDAGLQTNSDCFARQLEYEIICIWREGYKLTAADERFMELITRA